MKALTRREALLRTVQVSIAAGLPFSFTAASANLDTSWPAVSPPRVTAKGYGTDPDLVHPDPAPWPLTLEEAQKAVLQRLAELVIPAEGDTPSAAEVGAVAVIDEWVSAPYPEQQAHRRLLLAGLLWLDSQAATLRGDLRKFSSLNVSEQLTIVDSIAYPERITDPDLAKPVQFFALVRQLVVGAFYTSPEGAADLGYLGNVPIAGDYPGPTPAAKAHLDDQLKKLGLSPA